MPVDPVRDKAFYVLLKVFEKNAYLNVAVDRALRRRKISGRGQRFFTQLAYGTVRHKRLCDHVLRELVKQPLETLPLPILIVLRLGVFQSLFCRQVTHPAMVHTSVELAKSHGHAGTARLVNAVLRRAPQRLEDVALPDAARSLVKHLGVRYSLSDWLVARRIKTCGAEDAEAWCRAASIEAPMALRVNRLKTTPGALRERLEKAGIQTAPHPEAPDALIVLDGPPPMRSKFFQQGLFTICDPASMMPPHLLEPQPGERVLDLCAAPGVKTTHLAELAGGEAAITALDVNWRKLGRLLENAERLELPGILAVQADGLEAPVAGGGFDRVLVDAPCSGLGTLRRRPDLKWRAEAALPAKMAAIQQALLRSALALCKNGGVVVYSVCTFTHEETDEVIDACLANGGAAPENGPGWMSPWQTQPGRFRTSLLPKSAHGVPWDEFFLTRLRKGS